MLLICAIARLIQTLPFLFHSGHLDNVCRAYSKIESKQSLLAGILLRFSFWL